MNKLVQPTLNSGNININNNNNNNNNNNKNKIIKEGSVINKINFFNQVNNNNNNNSNNNSDIEDSDDNDNNENEELNNNIEILKEKIFFEPNEAINYFNLAVLLNNKKDKSLELLDGEFIDQKQLYVKSYNLDNSFIGSLNNLSTLLYDGNQEIYLNDQYPAINRLGLAKLVYEFDPTYSNICHNLAVYSKSKSSITLSNGTTINNKQLYIKSIEYLNPIEAWKSFYGLYFELEEGESIYINHNQQHNPEEENKLDKEINSNNNSSSNIVQEEYSKKDILVKILKLIKEYSLLSYYNNYYNSPISIQLSTVYYQLSNYLENENDNDTIQLPNLQDFESNNKELQSDIACVNSTINLNKKELLIESLKYNPVNYNIMLELAQIMNNQELLHLPFADGTSKSMGKVDILFLLINIELNNNNSNYNNNQSIVLKANQLYQNIKW